MKMVDSTGKKNIESLDSTTKKTLGVTLADFAQVGMRCNLKLVDSTNAGEVLEYCDDREIATEA